MIENGSEYKPGRIGWTGRELEELEGLEEAEELEEAERRNKTGLETSVRVEDRMEEIEQTKKQAAARK